MDGAQSVAAALARRLTPEITSLAVAQSYVPFLWRDGVLGGRAFSVLMSRLPMTVLQSRLDSASAAHPERATLADFRAPAWFVEAETEALAAAIEIITPHREIAELFGPRATRLAWSQRPLATEPQVWGQIRRVVFPGPTVARKGAYALREAAIALDLEVMLLGAELEGPAFWREVRTIPAGDWSDVDAMVQPAIVEEQPRRLLEALAKGLRVVATEACGLDPQPGLILVEPDNVAALIAALTR